MLLRFGSGDYLQFLWKLRGFYFSVSAPYEFKSGFIQFTVTSQVVSVD